MRKNSRMMELNSVVNRLLNKDSESRLRKLYLKTYAVIPLEERCGIIEWVPQTMGLRFAIEKSGPSGAALMKKDEIKKVYELPRLQAFRTMLQLCPPQLYRWFLLNFQHPTVWFEARQKFARSFAVWSMVGHLVGLGDRHGENILLDKSSGECMHVDFDCLFDAGKYLPEPEIVPFRLTSNIVDAFGVTGYEGAFRICSEKSLSVLRGNKDVLLNVLDSFLYDPLVEWTKGSPVNANSALDAIKKRLHGSIGAEALPLSVQGQVNLLIEEATSHDNLAKMYMWWLPWQ
eukprot:TRINITY_DN49930_c0_g3_i1.p1 TRINITY_DN49930_c0_g3~~TRINITY_DN49930_c0_g3_i1.p1  ORF type:complete len:338 (+),score=81.80 TRINITY_DN49930_c0_g3_i1:151-1014(+)